MNNEKLKLYTKVQDKLPDFYNSDGTRKWVWAAWQDGTNNPLRVYADKIGTSSCTADLWKEIVT